MSAEKPNAASRELPDWSGCMAEDVLDYCRPKQGLWMDLGGGASGLGVALALASESTVLLVDPNSKALGKAVEKASASGLAGRLVPIVAVAESIPLPEASVAVVFSRGSIFFWNDPPQGLREIYRVLRPGARALVGGGAFGTSYPAWAHEEFYRRRYEQLEAEGEEAVRKWNEPRTQEWLPVQAAAAGIEGALIEPTPPGRWLLFEKGKS